MKRPRPDTLVDLHVYGGLLALVVGTSVAYGILAGCIVLGAGSYFIGLKLTRG